MIIRGINIYYAIQRNDSRWEVSTLREYWENMHWIGKHVYCEFGISLISIFKGVVSSYFHIHNVHWEGKIAWFSWLYMYIFINIQFKWYISFVLLLTIVLTGIPQSQCVIVLISGVWRHHHHPPPHPHSLLKTPQKRLKVFDSPPHIIILKSHHIPFKNQKNIRN